jgi:hypothetical protein
MALFKSVLIKHFRSAQHVLQQVYITSIFAVLHALSTQVESLAKQVKQLEETLCITTREYILGECCCNSCLLSLANLVQLLPAAA